MPAATPSRPVGWCEPPRSAKLEIIGEAAGKLSDEFAQQRPHLPLEKARAMRNFIAHDYDDIHRDLVWEAICVSAPSLAGAVSELVDDAQQTRS